jgi:hypothetical protein
VTALAQHRLSQWLHALLLLLLLLLAFQDCPANTQGLHCGCWSPCASQQRHSQLQLIQQLRSASNREQETKSFSACTPTHSAS